MPAIWSYLRCGDASHSKVKDMRYIAALEEVAMRGWQFTFHSAEHIFSSVQILTQTRDEISKKLTRT